MNHFLKPIPRGLSLAFRNMFTRQFSYLIIFFTLLLLNAQPVIGQTYQDARQAYQAGDLETALEQVSGALDNTQDSKLLLLAGNIHTELAKKDSFSHTHINQAARYFEKAIQQTAENSNLHTDARLAQEALWQELMVKAASYEAEEEYTRALKLLEKAKLVLPEKAKAYLLAGKLAFGFKDYALAEQNFLFLVDSLNYDGNQIQAILNSLLTISLMEDSLVNAGEILSTAQNLEEDSINDTQMRIELLISKGKIDYAVQWIDSLVMSSEQKGLYYHEIGRKYQLKEDLQKSVVFYQRAIKADSTLYDAYYQLATNYQHLARQIIQTKEEADDLAETQNVEALTFLQEAKQMLEKLKQIQPDYPLLQYTLRNVEQTIERLS